MLGYVDSKTNLRILQRIIPIQNTSEEDQRQRFSVTPKDYENLERISKETGMTLLGFYHSHPDHPAQPSKTDLNFAWPNFSYIIVSVYDRIFKDIQSYELNLDTEKFQNESVTIEE